MRIDIKVLEKRLGVIVKKTSYAWRILRELKQDNSCDIQVVNLITLSYLHDVLNDQIDIVFYVVDIIYVEILREVHWWSMINQIVEDLDLHVGGGKD